MSKQWRRQFASLLLVVTFSVAMISVAQAATAPPNILSYQGRLLNANGVPVTSATASIKFKLYDSASGGTCLWSNSSSTCASETARTVTLSSGLFSENLGDTGATYAAIPNTVFADNASVYLGITIGADSEMTPRKRMTAAPYALNAQTLDGLDSTLFFRTDGTFNGASELVKLEGDGKLPAIDGSQLTNLPGGSIPADSLDFTDFADAMTLDAATTISGNILSLNTNSNFAVNINTGTSSGALSLGGGLGTVAINSSDWDIDATGAITGVSFDANGSGNSISNIENADIAVAAGIVYSKLSIADSDLTIAKTSGLQSALDGKLSLAGGSLTGDLTFGDTVPDSAKAIFDPGLGDTWNVYASSTGLHFDVSNAGAATMSLSNTSTGTTNFEVEGIVSATDFSCGDCLDFTELADAMTLDAATTISGNILSFNTNSDFAVNINTGTSTGSLSLGGGFGTVAINSSDWDIDVIGNISGINSLSVNPSTTPTDDLVSINNSFSTTSTGDTSALHIAWSAQDASTSGIDVEIDHYGSATDGLIMDGIKIIPDTFTNVAGVDYFNGIRLMNPTGDPGATIDSTGLVIQDGYDQSMKLHGATPKIRLDNAGALTFIDASSNTLMTLTDSGTSGTLSVGDFSCTDCLDFADFADSMTLDATTTIQAPAATGLRLTGTAAPTVDLFSVSTGVFGSSTNDVDGFSLTFESRANNSHAFNIIPTFNDGFAGSLNFSALNITDISATGQLAGNTVQGIEIGDMSENGAEGVTSSALKIGGGWDSALFFSNTASNITIADTGVYTFNNFSDSTLMTLTDNGGAGDLLLSGDLTLNGGDFDVTLNAGDGASITSNATSTATTLTLTQTTTANNTMGLFVNATQQDGTTAGANLYGGYFRMTGNDADGDMYGLFVEGVATINATAGTYEAGIIVDNQEDTAGSMLDGILIFSTGIDGGITDGIDVSDPNITNALNFGANIILGTTGDIDMTNFDVVGSSGDITTAGDIAINGGDITTTSATFNLANDATTLNLGSTNVTRAINIGTNTAASLTNSTIIIGGSAFTTNSITIGADLWKVVSGVGTFGGLAASSTSGAFSLLTNIAAGGSIDFATATPTLNIQSGSGTHALNIGGTGADTIAIASGSAATGDTISIGNTNIGTTLALTGGDDWSITAAGVATFGGDLNVSMVDGQTTNINGDGSPTVNLFQIGSGDTAAAADDTNVLVLSMDYNNVDGSYILIDTPAQIDANGSDRFRALEVEGFTFATTSTGNELSLIEIGNITVSSDNTGQIIHALDIGNVLQDTTGNIAANAISIGTGWDAEIKFIGTTPKIAIGDTGTLSVTDGTNVLLDVIDDGTVGRLSVGLNGTATTNGLCHSGANLDAASSVARDVVVCSGAPGDYAEWHETDGTVQSGDIVSTTSGIFTYSASESNAFTGEILAEKTQKTLPILTAATASQSENVLGVVSTSPNQTIGSDVLDQGAHPQPIALVGRVPVNVTNENGSIQVGDYITTSTTPGKGMKATYAGRVIGIALTGMNGASGQVTVQVTNSWYFGSLIGNDGTSTLLTDNVVVAPIGSASASTQTFDSYGLALRGSAWDGNQAQAVSMMFKNKVTDGTNYRLSVRNTLDSEVAYITNTGTMQVAGDIVVGGKIYPSNLGGIQTDKYIYYDGSAGPGGDFMRTNASGWSTGSYDFAEMFPSSEVLVAGDVVVFSSTNIHVKRSTKKDEKSIAGIVSTRPGFLAGENTPGSYPIALAGRVPTNVNNENGAIAVGDPLTTSSTTGFAMKATKAGPIVGYALEPFDGNAGKITVFVSAGYWGGDATSSTPGADNRASLFGSSGNSSMSTLSMGGNINMNGNEISNIGRMSGLTNSWSIEMDGTIKTEALLKTVIIGQNNQKVETIATTSPEAVITLSGSSTLKEGMAEVRFFEINKDFGNVISAIAPIRVVATPNGPVSLYVSEKDQNHFIVKSFGGNASDVEFDWVVTGYRKGFEPVVEETKSAPVANPVQQSAPSVTLTETVDSIETTISTPAVTESASTPVVTESAPIPAVVEEESPVNTQTQSESSADVTPSEVPASSPSASTTTVDSSVTNVDATAPTLSP